ncbi:MAG: hypothetical protein HZA93_27390 [Verrucomicrobia bacterium]|nr:hypothetical protein [Verrucomicrobiota bacterium]
MKTSSGDSAVGRERASALVTVLIFCFLLLVLVASLMQWSAGERRLGDRHAALVEARNAAEAVAEYGCYQVVRAFNTRMNPTFEAAGLTPVAFPESVAASFFTGSHVDPGSIELRAGRVRQVPASSLHYIDPNDPNNTFDPLSGRYVLRRDVTVLAKVTVTPSGGGPPLNAYVQQTVSVRGAPLFGYAIFYSGNDLEVNPSPQMDIYGPVHVNGNLFPGSVGSAAITFHGPVTVAGHVFHAWRGTTSTAKEGGMTLSANTPVYFSTEPTGVRVASMRTSAGVWNDSTMGASSSTSGLAALLALVTPARSASFVTFASRTWKGNLLTAAMGIQPYNPIGFSEVVARHSTTGADILATDDLADDGAVVGTGAGYGHGYGPHSLIEPSLATPPAASDPYQTAKLSIEEQKFANKAGLYIRVVVSAANTAAITFYGDPRSAPAGTPAASLGPNGGLLLGAPPARVIQFIPYGASGSGTSALVSTGMYDRHEGKPVNLVQLNLAALNTALTDMAGATTTAGTDILLADNLTKWGRGSTGGYDPNVPASSGWNGGIYVEVTSASTHLTGLLLANGKVARGGSLVPPAATGPNGVKGLTIATGAPVYLLGSYNADGVISTTAATNSAQYPDDGHTGAAGDPSVQTPAAVAGDTITILSANYFGTAASTNLAPYPGGTVTTNPTTSSACKSPSSTTPSAAASVEIAAAFISGTNSTSPDATGTQEYSGGVHNMPHFLENWGSNTVAIRGSLVSMYNSRVATGAWSISYYSAPIRRWGFDLTFANGTFPPICPQVVSYRRVDFTYLANGAEYATELARL